MLRLQTLICRLQHPSLKTVRQRTSRESDNDNDSTQGKTDPVNFTLDVIALHVMSL
jgi:hypothetical protein